MADGLKFAYKGPKREVSVEVPLSLFGIKDSLTFPFIGERDSSDEENGCEKRKPLDNPFRKEKDDQERFRMLANVGIFTANMILTAMKK